MQSYLLIILLYWRFRRRDRLLLQQSEDINYDDDNNAVDELIPFLLANQTFIHSRHQKAFHRLLSRMEQRRRERRVPRCSLQPPSKCTWCTLLNGRTDGAMITLTGLDFSSFEELHEKFKPFFNKLSPHRKSGVIEALQQNPKR